MFSVGEIAGLVGACVFAMSLAAGALLMPVMCRVSWRIGALDKPDGLLKRHRRITPTLGGVVTFVAFFLGFGLAVLVGRGLPAASVARIGWSVTPLGLLGAAVLLLAVGVRDDLRHVNPRTKLVFQLLAALILAGGGLLIRRVSLFGVVDVSLGVLAGPFTLFWLVGCCNAFNFLDGLDGLVAGVGVILSLVFAGVAMAMGAYGPALAALALAGSLAAALLFNFRPALIFLGDSGSQVIGLIVGALAIGVGTHDGVFNLPVMGIMLSIPVIDTLMSILRRYSRGTSAARGDHQHIHHCLQRRGLNATETSVTLWLAVLGCCAMAGAVWYKGGWGMALASAAFVAGELYVGAQLGCLDFARLKARLRGYPLHAAGQDVVALRRRAELAVLWDRMKPVFEELKLDRAVLTLEGIGVDGEKDCETLQWARSDTVLAAMLEDHWTQSFSVDEDERQVAVLRLEAAERWRRDEERIQRLLDQIRDNISLVSRARMASELVEQ